MNRYEYTGFRYEYTGFNGIKLKALRSIAYRGILLSDIDVEQGREDLNDRNGRIAYARGCVSHSQSIGIHGQEIYHPRQIRRRQGGRTLACQARGSQNLCGEPNQTKKQIKKATVGWHWTIENSALSFLPHAWKQRVKRPRDSLSVPSIHRKAKFRKRLQIILVNRACDRKKVCS